LDTELSDTYWMNRAIELAKHAENDNEVPVGAIIVKADSCIGEGWNQSISTHDPTAHAEIIALRNAAIAMGNYRLPNTTLYVTLEPCLMCIGAIMHARIEQLVFGALDDKRGAVCSALNLSDFSFLNHRIECRQGVEADRCSQILKDFFVSKRGLKTV